MIMAHFSLFGYKPNQGQK